MRIHQFGGPEVLQYEEASDPSPGAGQVLVRVKAASINRGDLSRRGGAFAEGAALPLIIGWEVSGIVEQLGAGVEGPPPGTRVLAYGSGGGYAELAVFPAENVHPIPNSLSFAEAAAIPVVFVSAWRALMDCAHTRAGETVLVQAAGSGVGMAGIQLAKHLGARVIATAAGERKLTLAQELGAEHAIDYQRQDFEQEVARLTGGSGVDVVLDVVGGEVMSKSVRALARNGRLVCVGNASRQSATIEPDQLYRKALTLTGMTTGLLRQPGEERERLDRILALVEQGELKSVVDRTFPLSQAAEAHRYLEARLNVGKVVLTVD
ncbi:MAG TPA: zinc-binding dehydrogenase [Dehalococcoidia bacterium]|nr:zinc-binding dehydrogenase [Dehalococcoidia bacterium]